MIPLHLPYPDVSAAIEALLNGVRQVLADRLIGLYLYGSLATGDFDPSHSDIDFLVATDDDLPDCMIPSLEQMHRTLWESDLAWTARLEGMYLPLRQLRRYNPVSPLRPTVNEGKFYLSSEGVDWVIQRWMLREHEAIVFGPSLREWIDPVSAEDLRRAVREFLRTWWAPMLKNPARLKDAEYQPYAVLSMCRARYLLEEGKVVSKKAAARWAAQRLDPEWKTLIEDALAWRRGDAEGDIPRTLEFMEYVLKISSVYPEA